MKKIAIYGAGGFGREVACMIDKINKDTPTWEFIGFFDDGHPIGEQVSHFGPILGGIAELNSWPDSLAVALCFGVPNTIKVIRDKIVNQHIYFPNLIDPDFVIDDPYTFKIGKGNIIKSQCCVTTEVLIGDFNVLNGGINFGHDVNVGSYNVFMPSSKISGEVIIGDCNLFGAYSFVKQVMRIGNNVTLSPLSALLTKPKDGNTYIGNPAKIFKF